MTSELLTMEARCQGSNKCLFDGQDLPVEIRITNRHLTPVGYPLEFRQKTGPSIRLVDTLTKADAYLKSNLADLALRDKFTEIPPGKYIALKWVIKSGEIEQFVHPFVDLSAEITLLAEVEVDGRRTDAMITDTIHITGKRKL